MKVQWAWNWKQILALVCWCHFYMVSKYSAVYFLCYWPWPYAYMYLLRYTVIHEACISRHAGTCIEINRDLYRSLQIFFSLPRPNPNLNKKDWICCTIFVICFIEEFVFNVQFYHQVPLHALNITMWSYFRHVFCTFHMIYDNYWFNHLSYE